MKVLSSRGLKWPKQIQKEIQQGVESWVALGNRRPHLSIILVGDNPASHTYVRNKKRVASAVAHVDERVICNGIAPEKDVDGFHVLNIGRLCLDQCSLVPATASAIWEIIKRTGIETFGENVVVAGRPKNVGMSIVMLLHTDGDHERPGGDVKVTVAHRYIPSEQLKLHTCLADIIIVAAGVPELVTSDMVKEGAAVIDVGINYVQDPVTGKTRLVGDVDFEALKKKASFITPVPGQQPCSEQHTVGCQKMFSARAHGARVDPTCFRWNHMDVMVYTT